MKKIAVVGLYSIPNMGDKILCEATQYLVKEVYSEAKIYPVDVCPRYPSDYKGLEYIKYRISRKMKTMGEKKFQYEDNSEYRYKYEYRYWSLRLNRYYKKILKNMDAIIFAGGGFLKFRTQGLNYYVEMIIKIAQEFNIPVMMNGVGIEGYDEEDIRCQNLKNIVNNSCVKIITTRDDVNTLENKYIYNENIVTDGVGDPALWTPECYGIEKDKERKIVSINAIRASVYKDYGNETEPDEIKEFYLGLIKELEKRNIKYRIFSNGMKGDQKFARFLINSLELSDEKIIMAPETSMELLEIIKSSSCIFGARLHACITAYSLDVPVVGLIWNEKTRIFARLIGKPNNYFEESEMNPVIAVDAIEKAIDEEYDMEKRNALKESTKKYVEMFINIFI